MHQRLGRVTAQEEDRSVADRRRSPSLPLHPLLELQRLVGNRTTASIVSRTLDDAIAKAAQYGLRNVSTWDDIQDSYDAEVIDATQFRTLKRLRDQQDTGIGANLRGRSSRDKRAAEGSRRSDRLGDGSGTGDGGRKRAVPERYGEYEAPPSKAVKRTYWSPGKGRPAYYESTWTACLAHLTAGTTANTWKCGQATCKTPNAELPRYNPSRSTANGITLDHIRPWEQWISEHAEPDEDGLITNRAAQDAYNDTGNLVAMCRDCNSSKNGPKAFFG